MILNRIKKTILISIFAAGTALGSGAAQAIAYTGSWDPAYGSAFPNLGWKGTATFEVPGGCLSGTGLTTIDFNTSCAAGVEMAIKSATVQLYLLDAPGTFETLVFDPAKSYVSSMDFSGGKLTGVHGGFFVPLKPIDPSLELGNSYFWLAFDGGPEMFHVSCSNHRNLGKLQNGGSGVWPFPSPTDSTADVKKWVRSNYSNSNSHSHSGEGEGRSEGRSEGEGSSGCEFGRTNWGWNDNGDAPGAGLMWTSLAPTNPTTGIPEPASLALVLSALGAGWVARRRRSS